MACFPVSAALPSSVLSWASPFTSFATSTALSPTSAEVSSFDPAVSLVLSSASSFTSFVPSAALSPVSAAVSWADSTASSVLAWTSSLAWVVGSATSSPVSAAASSADPAVSLAFSSTSSFTSSVASAVLLPVSVAVSSAGFAASWILFSTSSFTSPTVSATFCPVSAAVSFPDSPRSVALSVAWWVASLTSMPPPFSLESGLLPPCFTAAVILVAMALTWGFQYISEAEIGRWCLGAASFEIPHSSSSLLIKWQKNESTNRVRNRRGHIRRPVDNILSLLFVLRR